MRVATRRSAAAADALQKAVRGEDLVGRLGSDDFVLLLPGADSPYAREVAERARDAIVRVLPEEPTLTVSAGFVCYPGERTGRRRT